MPFLSKIALVGNPNSGKSTLFNLLTGLNQKVGNFPGVTVESLEASLKTFKGDKVQLIDLPGAYSLYTNSKDEEVLTHALCYANKSELPDGIIFAADYRYLHQQLLLLTQILDLNYPTLVVLTNKDQVDEEVSVKWIELLEKKTNCTVIGYSSRLAYTKIGLKEKLNEFIYQEKSVSNRRSIYDIPYELQNQFAKISSAKSKYHELILNLDENYCKKNNLPIPEKSFVIRHQIAETMSRFSIIENWESQIQITEQRDSLSLTKKLDRILTHPVWGIAIFIFILFFVFQLMYSWAEFPMNAIENAFAYTSQSIKNFLPDHPFSNLITDGIIPGLAGVLVFIPQIVFLFFTLTLLEEAGYMTRVVYMLDHVLARFGLNGRSIIGLISGGACAIPAIMSTRSIYNKKERLITMFVIPLIPCSARIPVYTALIGFVVDPVKIFGVFNLQGLVFMGLYLLGIGIALLVAFILHKIIPSEGRSILIMQLPHYQLPQLKLVLQVVYNKVKTFVIEAGKVIMIISIILWFLSQFSWPGEFENVQKELSSNTQFQMKTDEEKTILLESKKLEHSFAGKFGKLIEPAIEPLGFDWKIGIALITSFAAREVFVGTMSTIYSIGDHENGTKLREVLAAEKRPDGSKFFNHKTALSLILFYAFALQCMSTVAIMKRETGSWKIPLLQFIFLGLLAYLSSLFVYQLF
ncbi:MAG: ferrous iron transport protein B [Saprospiraceae bacterium]